MVATATATAVLATLPALGTATGAVASAEQGPVRSEGDRALAAAKESGHRVEVIGQRTERATVYANPDGYSFTLEQASVPVRVPAADGGWRTPDATLERKKDGTVGPRAAAPDMRFSGGGDDAPLASITKAGRKLALDWPGTLPEPELDGPSALYRDVLRDVDLKVTATTEGFQHVLIVKTPRAASDTRLKRLTFGIDARGLTVRESARGTLDAVDDTGRTVFRAPTAQMWDSAGKAAETARRGAAKEDRAMPTRVDLAETAPSGHGLEPGQGDKVARMDVGVSAKSLSVVPDPAMLTGTPASDFPLFIDPTVTWGEEERTLLRSDGYTSYGWGNGDDGRGKGAGKCGSWNGYYCGPGYVQRLYFEFSPSSLQGKQILDATFRVTEPWAFQCDPRWVDLVRTDNISSSTTWSSRPRELDWMGDRYVSAGRGSLCDPNSPTAPIEFNDNPEETDENLTPTVRDFAAGSFSRLTLEIRAHDESDTSAWKRFRDDAVLAVDFVGKPATPTETGLVTGSGTVCSTSESNPSTVSDPSPTLTATPETQSGGESGAELRIVFDLNHKNADGSWGDTPAGNGDTRPSSGYVGDGVKQTMSWSTLTDGVLYRYRAWTQSYYNGGGSYLTGPSGPWCYFKVDSTAPGAPQIAFGTPYTDCAPNSCISKGGPGIAGTFSFSPATGDTNIVSYQYTLSSMTTWPTVDGAQATVSVTPDRSGTHTLYVRALDTVGRYGAWNAVDFLVAAGEGPLARYHFDEASGQALDSATTGTTRYPATLATGATRDDRGRRGLITRDAAGVPLPEPVTDKGLRLDGATGYASTEGRVLETRSSYTVSAWVWVDPATTGTVSVISQTPDSAWPWDKKYSPFVISYGGRWSLRVFSTEGEWSREAMTQAYYPDGVWTHVAGVHDAVAKKVYLYVNGKQVASVDAGTPWSANGPLQIGRVMYADNYVDNFNGSIDEVTVWQRALTPKEVGDEAKLLVSAGYAGVELVADWRAGQGSGGTVPDVSSGYGKSLTLMSGASLIDGVMVFDGVDDEARSPMNAGVVDGTGSFTMTTTVALDGAKLATQDIGYAGAVLSQRAHDGISWGIWYELTGKATVLDEQTMEERTVPVGKWHFGTHHWEGGFTSVVSDEVAAVDSTVRLTGVYDAATGKISLYLGRSQNGTATPFPALEGASEVSVGSAWTDWWHNDYLPARIGEVRLFAGAIAGPEQIDTYIGD
ncbi:LamG domain-containing protein [Streptomyces sp. NPDC051909]|uniref:LamG domain-containing protein n=1 Tax=Streptomyces sp. NPDC051909 TaxID=3154944 RepID=UPI003449F96D